ncbi:MAG TPA: hypothetical protein VJY62_12875 [Bacteroidia bacterium]|nr:hypothetical protein [Bacteroidia bacterium]
MRQTSKGITNLQMELMKIFSIDLSEKQILDLKRVLVKFFSDNATNEMDNLWDEKKWNNKTMKKWAKEHLRTTIK